MKYLPALTQSRNPVVHLTYGLPNRCTRVAPAPVLPRPVDANNISRRVPEQQSCADLSNGSEEQSLNRFSGNPLETFLSSFFAHSSRDYLCDQQIAAYRKAQRVLHADAEMTFRFVDLYV
jgi:hypothetical protein